VYASGRSGVWAELGGPLWGLLPALASLPWLVWWGGGLAGVRGCFLLSACLMASFDLATRRIPNLLCLVTALAGVGLSAGLAGWQGLGTALLGGLVAFGLMLPFHLLGVVGAGDVKGLGALGCFLGAWGAVQLFLYTVLAGGLLAVAWLLARRQRDNLPYGLAMAGGALATVVTGGL